MAGGSRANIELLINYEHISLQTLSELMAKVSSYLTVSASACSKLNLNEICNVHFKGELTVTF